MIMTQHFPRKKHAPLLLRLLYRLNRLIILKNKTKLNLYLDLEWIFSRLAHETAKAYYTEESFPFKNRATEFLLNKIDLKHTVLDLGCGLGSKSFLIAQKATSVIGVDYNIKNIERAQSTFKLHNLKYLNIDALLFLDSCKQKFDVLILSHILEHIENPKDLILRYKSYFQLIYIEVPDIAACDLNPYRIDLNSNFRYTDDDHLIEFDRVELIKMLNECNLKIIDAEYIFGVQKYWCAVN
jgi:SAM-dependent methyltransferase